MHKLFESQYNEIELIVNEVAERTGKLGEKAIGPMKEFLDESVLKESSKFESKEAMVKELLSDHQELTTKITEFIKKADEADDFGTADLLTGIILKHEAQAWILRRYSN